jgi:two-component system, sensor histidine kinase PdtaS
MERRERGQPVPDERGEIESLRLRVAELEDECEQLRIEAEDAREWGRWWEAQVSLREQSLRSLQDLNNQLKRTIVHQRKMAETARVAGGGQTVPDVDLLGDQLRARNEELQVTNEELQVVVEELIEKQEALEEVDFVSALLDAAGAYVVVLDAMGRIARINRAAAEEADLSPDAAVGAHMWEVLTAPGEADDVRRALAGLEATGPRARKDWWTRGAPGRTPKLVTWSTTVLRDADGQVRHVIAIGIDVTDRRRAEDALRLALSEKELLLREVHHRVKNNLQVMSSMLALQLASVPAGEARSILQTTEDRLRSLAVLYNHLYRSPTLSEVQLGPYIGEICASLAGFHNLEPAGIKLAVDTGHLAVDVDLAVPCGLIVNELVSNALEHAFRDARPAGATVRVVCALGDDGNALLEVSDNGVGLSRDASTFGNSAGLGLQLVETLVTQIRGTLEVDTDGGTTFRITFPV